MNYLVTKIAEYSNLYWAWEKARFSYKPGDIWFDELELAHFEINLQSELMSIRTDILGGTYTLRQIIPIPFPKSKNGDGPQTRQTFWISIRDQVTWLAVVNIIGGTLDSKMPFWSYGNRLFIPVFKNEDDSSWKFGYYRNTSKYTYRNWKQSWPLYRRHINITCKILSRKGIEFEKGEIDEIEESLLLTNRSLTTGHPLKVEYLERDFWQIEFDGELYWASVDLEKFYPRVKQSAIKRNIMKFLEGHYDQQIDKLLNQLFDFNIDFSNWNREETNLIGLDNQIGKYENIPTGLFVGGFLANVALLEVDQRVHKELERRKSIAHFRYVDDHVILSKNFNDLINWIEYYQKILSDEDIGTSFNYSKTEPLSLALYFEQRIDINSKPNESRNDELYGKAKSECKLDPEFPSPLMTQTLAKVSNIVHTNFELLTPQEERSLISDVEHLLLTEFPDQELKKDTRVSFAARILSTLVPELSTNIDTIYLLKKKIAETNTEINKLNISRIKEVKNSEQEKLLFELTTLSKVISDLTLQELKEENAISSSRSITYNRTLKLLLKAVRENHDKVRLWTRICEFYLNSGMSRMDKLFDEIKELKARNESNTLSISFIDALLLQVLSNLLFQSFKILSDINYPIRKKDNAKQFIFNILTDEVFCYIAALENVATKSHQKSAIHVFKFTSGSIMYLIRNEFAWPESNKFNYFIIKYRLIDWDNPQEFSSQTEFSFSTWSWWILNKLPTRNLFEKPYLWDEVTNNLNLTESSSIQILELYPFHINRKILKELDNLNEQGLNNEGVLFDICKALKVRNEENNFNFLQNTKKKINTENGYISLCDWIDWTKQRQDHLKSPPEGQLIFDPRLTEWAALEIIVRVAKCVQEKIESIPFFDLNEKHEYTTSIHPSNFIFSNEVINTDIVGLTWEKTRAIFDHPDFKVEFKPHPNLVRDLRYVPSMHLISQSEKVEACINGLGSLLVCLLAKNYFLPSKWNPLGHQLTWTNLYREKLRDVPISSFTRNILDGCFSKKNKETKFRKTFQIELSFIPDDDTLNDPPDFFDIGDFIYYVLRSKENLEMQQISVANHQPRQLTPINLKMFRRNNHQENYNNDI